MRTELAREAVKLFMQTVWELGAVVDALPLELRPRCSVRFSRVLGGSDGWSFLSVDVTESGLLVGKMVENRPDVMGPSFVTVMVDPADVLAFEFEEFNTGEIPEMDDPGENPVGYLT